MDLAGRAMNAGVDLADVHQILIWFKGTATAFNRGGASRAKPLKMKAAPVSTTPRPLKLSSGMMINPPASWKGDSSTYLSLGHR
jgi:hypothetical protein